MRARPPRRGACVGKGGDLRTRRAISLSRSFLFSSLFFSRLACGGRAAATARAHRDAERGREAIRVHRAIARGCCRGVSRGNPRAPRHLSRICRAISLERDPERIPQLPPETQRAARHPFCAMRAARPRFPRHHAITREVVVAVAACFGTLVMFRPVEIEQREARVERDVQPHDRVHRRAARAQRGVQRSAAHPREDEAHRPPLRSQPSARARRRTAAAVSGSEANPRSMCDTRRRCRPSARAGVVRQ